MVNQRRADEWRIGSGTLLLAGETVPVSRKAIRTVLRVEGIGDGFEGRVSPRIAREILRTERGIALAGLANQLRGVA